MSIGRLQVLNRTDSAVDNDVKKRCFGAYDCTSTFGIKLSNIINVHDPSPVRIKKRKTAGGTARINTEYDADTVRLLIRETGKERYWEKGKWNKRI